LKRSIAKVTTAVDVARFKKKKEWPNVLRLPARCRSHSLEMSNVKYLDWHEFFLVGIHTFVLVRIIALTLTRERAGDLLYRLRVVEIALIICLCCFGEYIKKKLEGQWLIAVQHNFDAVVESRELGRTTRATISGPVRDTEEMVFQGAWNMNSIPCPRTRHKAFVWPPFFVESQTSKH
jgi:hypothetical protein